LLAGCASHRPAPELAPQRFDYARSVGGQSIEVFACGRGEGGVLVLGGVHGDERGSALLVRTLAERLDCAEHATLTVVPALNPDGLQAGTRTNARGVDLNRNMPARSWTPAWVHGDQPLSEPESGALDALLRHVRPALTISVHEANVPLVDWDGPAGEAAGAIAVCMDLPLGRIGARPGSLGALLGEDWGWPLVTIELPRAASAMDADALWDRYGDCLLEAID
jgi:protein MpaA